MDSILSRRAFGAGALPLWPARGDAGGAPLPGFDLAYGPLASLAALDTALFGAAEFGPAVMPKGAVDIP